MKPIIEINKLGKEYQIGGKKQGYQTLRESLFSILNPNRYFEKEKFWALNNINFSVSKGESLGIIGRNGAGKSTLLKVLSKITPPSKGLIRARGRVASLLEVGTGFHPELTGSENIFLNGSILGLTRSEIRQKFDEIVDFSGVEKFLETPLKHYSSGMQLRLAFAVAAHLEPEILVIDEVLAVGDVAFQQKCLGKMDEVSKSGRTILFVSHNMSAVKELCTRCVLLDHGEVTKIGSTDEVIDNYYDSLSDKQVYIADHSILKAFSIDIVEETGKGKIIDATFEIDNKTEDDISIHFIVKNKGQKLLICSSELISRVYFPPGEQKIKCRFGPVNLLVGEYQIDLLINVPKVENLETYRDIIEFKVETAQLNDRILTFKGRNWGYIVPEQTWSRV